MDPYLASDDVELLKLWDVGWVPSHSPDGQSYRDMIAQPGRRLDVVLTDLVPGSDLRLSGQVTRVPVPGTTDGDLSGDEVCAFSRAGYACARTNEMGRYELSLPTKVSPEDPAGPVAVKMVAHPTFSPWRAAVDHFTATPGTNVTHHFQLEPVN